MGKNRLCLKILASGAVVSLIVLLTRELLVTTASRPSVYPRLLVSYLNEHMTFHRSNSTVRTRNKSRTVALKSVVSTRWNRSAHNITYPMLYDALKPVSGPVNFSAAVAASAAAAASAGACQRPKSESMVHCLQANATPEMQLQEPKNSGIVDGGFWAPRSCWPPLSRTAVLVPYRNRSKNLDTFVPYMHRLLRKQNILFGLFVVEQADWRLFNRAKLLNIGFLLSQRFYQFDCFVFHDSDKVPENVANVYDCKNAPKLLISEMRSQASSKYSKGKLYHNFFGGVSAVTKDAFVKINGNSNRYYGWGREDDELAARLSISGFSIRYSGGAEARYINLRHSEDVIVNKMPWPYAHKVRQTMATDGLNSVNYTGLSIHLHPLFVLIRAEV